MSELKPCPFCGGKAKAVRTRAAEDEVIDYVECAGCGARSAEYWSPMGNKAPIELWNTRIEDKGGIK